MTVSSSKKLMLVAALTSAIVASVAGTAQAAPDFTHNSGQVRSPMLILPVLPKPAAGNFDNRTRAVATGGQNQVEFTKAYRPNSANQTVKFNNTASSVDHRNWSHSADRRFWRRHDRNIGDNFWGTPDMFANDFGQIYQYSANTCRSLAIRLNRQHLPFIKEKAILRNHGCDINHIG